MIFVALGLGSNRKWNSFDSVSLLRKACTALDGILSGTVVSSVYRTKPMYVENQEPFYNMVLCGFVSDDTTARSLLDSVHRIEASLGRDRSREIRNGPRSVDIDIEFFGDSVVSEPDLQIPHPRIKERAFVLIPLLEISDKFADFINRESLCSMVKQIKRLEPSDVEKVISASDFLR